jgi:hypothetical protein
MSEDTYWINGMWQPLKPKPKCECGVTITMGADDSPEMHSDYCPVRQEYDRDKKLKKLLIEEVL